MTEPTERDRKRAVEIEERIIFRTKQGLDAIGLSYVDPSPKALAEYLALHISEVRAEERERCAKIADQYRREVLPVDPGGIARLIAGQIRSGE